MRWPVFVGKHVRSVRTPDSVSSRAVQANKLYVDDGLNPNPMFVLLEYWMVYLLEGGIVLDRQHGGKIVMSGGRELATKLDEEGYDWMLK